MTAKSHFYFKSDLMFPFMNKNRLKMDNECILCKTQEVTEVYVYVETLQGSQIISIK